MANNYIDNVKQTFILPPRDIFYAGRDSYEFDNFIKLLGYVMPNKITPEELIVYMKFLLNDIKDGTCRFLNSKIFRETFEHYVNMSSNLDMWLTYMPSFIEAISSPEFNEEFLELFRHSFYHIEEDQQEQDYGCVEIEPDVIDISNKDKAEVLAALYNFSKPIGMGIVQYDPTPMTVEIARMLIEKKGYYYDYLKGRTMKVNLEGNIVSVRLYNSDNNHPGLAQKAISTCKNINKDNIQKKKTL